MGADSAAVASLGVAEILPHLDERQRRLYLGSEARALGGGLAAAAEVVAAAAGVSRATVMAGSAELAGGGAEPVPGRRGGRGPGAGGWRTTTRG